MFVVGMWLSLVERLTGGQEAAGSSPVIPIVWKALLRQCFFLYLEKYGDASGHFP